MVVKIFLSQTSWSDCAVLFQLDNQVAVRCLNRQGSSRSAILLAVTESIFLLASARRLALSAQYLPGQENVWADALSRRRATSTEWSLSQQAFQRLSDVYGRPQVDLFAHPDNHRLPLFLTRHFPTTAGGPDALLEDWNRWQFVYLFPPPTTQLMLRVCQKLGQFRGKVLLIAPRWVVQPWFAFLLQWCPNPRPLLPGDVRGPGLDPSQNFFAFHAWVFSPSCSQETTPL